MCQMNILYSSFINLKSQLQVELQVIFNGDSQRKINPLPAPGFEPSTFQLESSGMGVLNHRVLLLFSGPHGAPKIGSRWPLEDHILAVVTDNWLRR